MQLFIDTKACWQRQALLRAALLLVLLWQAVPAGAASPSEQADDLLQAPLEQLLEIEVEKVYSASRFEQDVTEAPASVSIITSDDIKKSGYRTLAEILNGVRGFYTSNDRNYSYLGVRGFSRPGD